MSDITCLNCGRKGHKFKECKFPITSYGIICLNFNNEDLKPYIHSSNKSKYSSILDPEEYSDSIDRLKKELKILMVCRKDTIGYIELIRGNYEIDDVNYIEELFSFMTLKEKERILKNKHNFDYLWIKLWSLDHQNVDCQRIENEYSNAKGKFEKLVAKYDFQKIVNKINTEWTTPEWGFPKGRRDQRETDVECARREFEEETGLESTDYEILNIKPIYENFKGCNGVNYRHIYYVAQSFRDELRLSQNDFYQVTEISAIQWVTYQQAMDLIRDYNREKKKSLKYLFNLLKNIINNSA